MTFYLASNGGNCTGCEWVAAQGEITTDTPKLFRKFVEDFGSIYHISLHSPGGNLVAGIQLGQLIRETGATTQIGQTVSMGAGFGNYKTTAPGVCASACAFAFMGGLERHANDGELGVHQFYSSDETAVNSEITQALVGYSLIHTLRMGIDAGVIVAASRTSPDDIHWFDRNELIAFGLDTSGTLTDAWRLEPYKSGLVLTTHVQTSPRRAVSVTLFCRVDTRRWHFLLTEQADHQYVNELSSSNYFKFPDQFSAPTLSLGDKTFRVTTENVEFLRFSGDQIRLSLHLPHNLAAFAGQQIALHPDLARVYNDLLSVAVSLPNTEWLNITANNCI